MFSRGWGTAGRTVAMVAIAVMAACAFGAATADATPAEPTLSLAGLQTKLDSSPNGIVTGYMKTVLHGSLIETIPVNILAITNSGAVSRPASLILLQATGPKIDAVGGIAEGMSGSPIFVDDAIVGALSYGDVFTLGGTALATPIDPMAQLETDYPLVSAKRLSSAGTLQVVAAPVGGLSITLDAKISSLLGGRRTIQARPLASLMVGGLPSSNPVFKAFSAHMSQLGVDVVSTVSALGAGDPSFTTTLTGGAAVAALAARGNCWIGGVGTVTYATDDAVVAFGHPMFWTGSSQFAMANAWIDGVWPSNYVAYKMAEPGALRGTITQDRGAGILGRQGVMPAETPITVHVIDKDSGQATDTTTWMPRYVIDSALADFKGIAPFAAYVGTKGIFDQSAVSGSAATTTTVVVSDGTKTYTLTRTNVFDDASDITNAAVADVSDMILAFQQAGTNGIAHPDILSVDLQVAITSRRNSAQVVDVQAPNGLAWGPNTVRVSVLRYGIVETQTVETTLDIPVGTSLTGVLSVDSNASLAQSASAQSDFMFTGSASLPDRSSVSDVVNVLDGARPNSQLLVTFQPTTATPSGLSGLSTSALPSPASTAVVNTDWVMSGSTTKIAPRLTATSSSGTVAYNGRIAIAGSLEGASEPSAIVITGREAGSATDVVLALATATVDPLDDTSPASFTALVGGLRKTTTLTIRYPGSDTLLAAVTSVRVNVAAAISVRSSASSVARGRTVTLTATTSPRDADGSVVFEYLRGARWTRIGSVVLHGTGMSAARWAVPRGRWSVRSRYVPGSTNSAATSRRVAVTGK